MVKVTFYEKPGCATNARQKAMLAAAGHELDVRSILAEPWSAEQLRAYFGDQPVNQWFNMAAPRVKSGEIDPLRTNAETALAMMVDDHLLIRRPLMATAGWRSAGFNAMEVDARIGLMLDRTEEETGPFEGCTHGDTGRTCAQPA